MNKTKIFLKKHYLALIFATLVGLIYLMPHLIGIMSLGDKYQGIPMMGTANEDAYLFRMRDIIDGHYLLGSPVFFEYKDEWPLMPPVGEMFYALPSLLFGISLTNVSIASKFILPFILFLLAYFLIHKLAANVNLLSNKINAISGALLIVLGYDLVDYRSLWIYLTGDRIASSFLLWSRPVNPVLGAIFLFSFLLCLWSIANNNKYKKTLIIFASIFLSLMIGSYFFSWGLALSILAVLSIIYFALKKFVIVKGFAVIGFLTIILTLPYWYMSYQANKSLLYKESVLRTGLFYTHYPIFNKVLLATLLFYFILSVPTFYKKLRLIVNNRSISKGQFSLSNLKPWRIFCLSFIFGGFLVFSQQIITGITIWPFHFVQYTIPLSMVVVLVLIYNVIKIKFWNLWRLIMLIVISSSFVYGIWIQAGTYSNNFNYFTKLQTYKPAFDWLNNRQKDCVVLVIEPKKEGYGLNNLIPAFTHCNVYAGGWGFSLMPSERLHYNYMVNIRLGGIGRENISQYLEDNKRAIQGVLASNWQGIHNVRQFPDSFDPLLEERLKKFPKDYQEFLAKDFETELKKYRLDYILSTGPLEEEIINQFSDTELVFQSNDIFIYKF
ncbi:MAG: hypothetical protein ABIE43_05745 [Patescibacteria group bacterium]